MKKLFLIFISALIVCGSISSCESGSTKYTEYSFEYFDTVTTVVGYEKSEEDFKARCSDIFALLGEYHRLFTIYNRYEDLENLCTVNELVDGEHRTVKVDPRVIEMLDYAKNMHALTEGKMNIAMGSVLSIWHDYRTEGMDDPSAARLPSLDELTEASKYTDIANIVTDEAASTVTVIEPKARLDVGAIAKGYAVEMAAKMLEEAGVSGYVINVGGNVRTVGSRADGTKWLVGIENPDESATEPYIAYLELAGESLVTSGSYQRYYVVDGKKYHHIIDPDTLYPSEKYTSVSVITEHSGRADALSTALFVMDFEHGMELVESIEKTEALWLFPDGTIKTSSGFDNYRQK